MSHFVPIVLNVVAVLAIVFTGLLYVIGTTVETRPTTAQATPTVANYTFCLDVQMRNDASVEDALRRCDSQRPDSISKKTACMSYVTMSGMTHRYGSNADADAELRSCPGY